MRGDGQMPGKETSLSYNERKQLEEMERQVRSEDPVFARKFEAGVSGPSTTARSWPAVLLLVAGAPGRPALSSNWSGRLLLLAGVLVILIGIGTQLPIIGIMGFLLIVIGGYQYVHEPGPRQDPDEPVR
jgi:hypothetical protein